MSGFPSLLYFAYGSNMHPQRMAERVWDARLLGVGRLSKYLLRFHKRGQDGSGKCNLMYTGDGSDTVHGVVYAVDGNGKRALDLAENGYRPGEVSVLVKDENVACFTYTAEPGLVDDSLRPFGWYKRYVLDGSAYHCLPAEYIRAIDDIKSVADPDGAREALHLDCLRRMHAL